MIDAANITDVKTVATLFVEYAPRDRTTALDFASTVKDEMARVVCTLKLTLKGVDEVAEGEPYKYKGKEYKVVGIDQHYSSRSADETYTELLLARA